MEEEAESESCPRPWLEMGNEENKCGVGSCETCRDIKQAVRHSQRSEETFGPMIYVGISLTQMVSNALEMDESTWKMVCKEEMRLLDSTSRSSNL